MYLIIGASGRLGSVVSRRLLEAGQEVRAQSRDPDSKLQDLIALGAEPVRGDLKDDGWLDDAMRGGERVLLASQAAFPPSRTNHPEIVDEPGNRRVIDAARRAGVEHIVFMSTPLASPDSPSRFMQIKYLTEEYLKKSGVAYTILRPPVFMEIHLLVLLGEPLASDRPVQFFGSGQTPLRWISVNDVANCVIRSFDDPDHRNTTLVIGGPDVMTRVQALEVLERQLGKRAKRRHMPLALMRAMRVLTKPLHPGLSDVISFAIAEETMPDHPGFAPSELDWRGQDTVEDVVTRWVAARQPAVAVPGD